jgi:hypothetical protein
MPAQVTIPSEAPPPPPPQCASESPRDRPDWRPYCCPVSRPSAVRARPLGRICTHPQTSPRIPPLAPAIHRHSTECQRVRHVTVAQTSPAACMRAGLHALEPLPEVKDTFAGDGPRPRCVGVHHPSRFVSGDGPSQASQSLKSPSVVVDTDRPSKGSLRQVLCGLDSGSLKQI